MSKFLILVAMSMAVVLALMIIIVMNVIMGMVSMTGNVSHSLAMKEDASNAKMQHPVNDV